MSKNAMDGKKKLTPYLGVMGAWALAFGCSVGQGAFVMPGTIFLPLAGPWGSVLGIVLGALIMLILARNYAFLMNRFPDNGGTYTYSSRLFGYDHGFLNAWFLILTYLAVLWANASALPVVARTLLGNLFQFGFHYTIAGFDIYLGEILLSFLALFLGAFLCMRKSLAVGVQIGMGVLLLLGAGICFTMAILRRDPAQPLFEPAMGPDGCNLYGVFTVTALAPWAYVGFESIAHSPEEMKFPLKKVFRVLAVSLLTSAVAYGLLILLAVTRLPEGCATWTDYIARLGEYAGLAAQPTFFASNAALGNAGNVILGIAAVSGIFTGIVGNYIALSRLTCRLSEDRMMPRWIGQTDRNGVPRRAIFSVLGISLVLPFFGRTWISWIVYVTTVGATICYAFTSAAALRGARESGDRTVRATGLAGLVVSLLFALAFLVPNLLAVKTLATESYLILAAWGLLGFVVYLFLLHRDQERRLGRSNMALIVLFALILFTSTVWMRQATQAAVERSVTPIHSYYMQELKEAGIDIASEATRDSYSYLEDVFSETSSSLTSAVVVQVGMIVVTLALLFLIYSRIQRREREVEVEKALAEDASRAKTSFLSNMSHEIRTPLNAIIGLDHIALRNSNLQPETRDQLEKIGASAKHLLGLINDILDMSRIESGRMTLKDEPFSLRECLNQVNIIISGQCADKGLRYECNTGKDLAECYSGDQMKLK